MVVLAPITNKYSIYIAGVNFPISDLLLIFVIVSLIFMTMHKKHSVIISYAIFIFYAILVSLLKALLQGDRNIFDVINKLGRLVLYFFAAGVISQKYFEMEKAGKVYIRFSFILSIYLIIQYIVFKASSVMLPNILLQNMRLNYSFNGQDASTYTLYKQLCMSPAYWRPPSLFLEVAHFAQYTTPALLLCLVKGEHPKTFFGLIIPIVITIANLLSFSANAVVFLCIAWGCLMYKYMQRKQFIKALVVTFIVLTIGVIVASQTDVFVAFLERLATISSKGGSTGTQRILRGYYIYGKAPILDKLFGMGFGNISYSLIDHAIRTPYDGTLALGHEYMNSLAYILVGTGLVGAILFIILMINAFKRGCFAQKGMIILLLVMMSSSSILMTPTYMQLMTFICSGGMIFKGVEKNEYCNCHLTLYR